MPITQYSIPQFLKFPLLFSPTCQLSRTKRKVIQLGLQRSAVLSLVPTHVCTQWQISAHTFHILSCSMQFPYSYVYTIYIGHVWWHGKNHATLPFLVRQSVTVLIFAQNYCCPTLSLLCPSFLSNNIIFPLSLKFFTYFSVTSGYFLFLTTHWMMYWEFWHRKAR